MALVLYIPFRDVTPKRLTADRSPRTARRHARNTKDLIELSMELEPPRWLFPCLFPDWCKARNTAPDIVMFHLPTSTAFAIAYDPDHAMIGGLTIFGFAARIYQASGTTPETAQELEALGQEAITAWLHHFMYTCDI